MCSCNHWPYSHCKLRGGRPSFQVVTTSISLACCAVAGPAAKGHGRPRFGAKKQNKNNKKTHTHTHPLCICVCICTPAFFQGLIFGLRVESRLEHSHVLFSTPDVSRFFQRTRRSTSLCASSLQLGEWQVLAV